VDDFTHNNPQGLVEERFERLEVKVTNMSHNMNLLMVALARKLDQFGDDGGSNS
jgi:hypothetical protein